jgi:hypothetical protein
MIVHYLG